VEHVIMNSRNRVKLEEPVIEHCGARSLAGMRQHVDGAGAGAIPALWQRFAPYIGHVPGQVGSAAYGVVSGTDKDGGMDYLCGVEVSGGAPLPAELVALTVPAHRYLLFKHRGHISEIGATWMAIMGQWLPASSYRADQTPCIERYTERFDPRTGMGEVDMLVPVQA
jgi:AraC family transcriptional regulator